MTSRRRVRFQLPFPVFVIAMLCALTVIAARPAQAQTFSVLHYFTGGTDGGNPAAGVTIAGPGGILYGTTSAYGAPSSLGTVFKLTQRGSDWTLDPLYEFTGPPDGSYPYAGVVIGPNGALYGTTVDGGVGNAGFGFGTVFEVQPPATACKTAICYWNETILHAFTGYPGDGAGPEYGNVTFDQAGNMYGTASDEGASNCGVVWELAPSGGGWTESVLYNFTDGIDGCNPYSGVIFDSAGNLYGVTLEAGAGAGALFQLTLSNGSWVEHTLVEFNGTTGIHPYGTLITDESGNLYGTARDNGPHGDGTVFELSPSNGGWTFSLVYAFSSCNPIAGVTLGPDGNLYGVCRVGGADADGWVFEMPPNCNGTCTPTDLHDFNGSDGANPFGQVVFDASGNLYGTTFEGGRGDCTGVSGCGVVWEITP
jgi:uncharacterized repeat protein (TIGR03803 family)